MQFYHCNLCGNQVQKVIDEDLVHPDPELRVPPEFETRSEEYAETLKEALREGLSPPTTSSEKAPAEELKPRAPVSRFDKMMAEKVSKSAKSGSE